MIFTPDNAAMVLAGRKVMTRRLAKQGDFLEERFDDVLRVHRRGRLLYKVGNTYAVQAGRGRGAVGRVRITAIRRENVQDITPADCVAEGIVIPEMLIDDPRLAEAARWAGGFDSGHCQLVRVLFRDLWDELHGAGAWDRNGPVYVLTLEVVEVVAGGEPGRREVANAR